MQPRQLLPHARFIVKIWAQIYINKVKTRPYNIDRRILLNKDLGHQFRCQDARQTTPRADERTHIRNGSCQDIDFNFCSNPSSADNKDEQLIFFFFLDKKKKFLLSSTNLIKLNYIGKEKKLIQSNMAGKIDINFSCISPITIYSYLSNPLAKYRTRTYHSKNVSYMFIKIQGELVVNWQMYKSRLNKAHEKSDRS